MQAFLPDMPFQLAYSTIARLIRTRVHMQREGQVTFFSFSNLLKLVGCSRIQHLSLWI